MVVVSLYIRRGGTVSMILDGIRQGEGDQENTILKGMSKIYGLIQPHAH